MAALHQSHARRKYCHAVWQMFTEHRTFPQLPWWWVSQVSVCVCATYMCAYVCSPVLETVFGSVGVFVHIAVPRLVSWSIHTFHTLFRGSPFLLSSCKITSSTRSRDRQLKPRTDNQDVSVTVMEAHVAPTNEAGLKSTSVTIPEQI